MKMSYSTRVTVLIILVVAFVVGVLISYGALIEVEKQGRRDQKLEQGWIEIPGSTAVQMPQEGGTVIYFPDEQETLFVPYEEGE